MTAAEEVDKGEVAKPVTSWRSRPSWWRSSRPRWGRHGWRAKRRIRWMIRWRSSRPVWSRIAKKRPQTGAGAAWKVICLTHVMRPVWLVQSGEEVHAEAAANDPKLSFVRRKRQVSVSVQGDWKIAPGARYQPADLVPLGETFVLVNTKDEKRTYFVDVPPRSSTPKIVLLPKQSEPGTAEVLESINPPRSARPSQFNPRSWWSLVVGLAMGRESFGNLAKRFRS